MPAKRFTAQQVLSLRLFRSFGGFTSSSFKLRQVKSVL